MAGRPFKQIDVICLTYSLQIPYQDNFTQMPNSSKYARKAAVRSRDWYLNKPLTLNLNVSSRLINPNEPSPPQPYTR